MEGEHEGRRAKNGVAWRHGRRDGEAKKGSGQAVMVIVWLLQGTRFRDCEKICTDMYV